MQNSQFVLDAELTNYINDSIAWLYDEIVGSYGDEYYATSVDFTTVTNQKLYSFTSIGLTTFYKLLGISMLDGTQEIPLRKFVFGQRGDVTNLPEAGKTIRVYWIPAPTKLVADGDLFDGVSGWEELVIIDAAIKCKDKEETDISVLDKERDIVLQRVRSMAPARDTANPERVTDVRSQYDSDFFDDPAVFISQDYNAGRSVPRYRLHGDGIMLL
jgi:hypothetical protein